MVAATGAAEAREGWSSRTAFIMASIGAAVGLGNIWRFPSVAGENGGGAFVLFYIACVALIGLPLVISELFIGRHGQSDALASFRKVARDSQVSPMWSGFAAVGAIASFFVLSFYSVVAGWVLYYAGVMGGDLIGAIASGDPFRGALAGQSDVQIQQRLGDLLADPVTMTVMHAVFMGATALIVARGISGGIEKAATWLMPMFFVLLLAMTIYGAVVGDMGEAAAFLFSPDWSKLTPGVMNAALGQACFSLSVGSALLITYGSYLHGESKLGGTAGVIAVADTGVAIIAGLMIFPIVFAIGLDPTAGPTLIFQTLPFAFQSMPAGSLVGFLFFVLIVVAAITSSIALLEVPVAWAEDAFGWNRHKATLLVAASTFLIGIACLLGYNVWSDVRPLWFWPTFAETDILDAIDSVTGKVMLPIAALGVAIFVGWRADRSIVAAGTGLSGLGLTLFRVLIAWVAPLAVALILLLGLFPGILG